MKKILLFIVVTILISGCKYFEEKRLFSKKVDTLINYAEKLDKSADSVSTDISTEMDQINPETDVSVDSEQSGFKSGYPGSGNRYHIVTGCFMIPEFAERYADKMKDMGYNPEIVLRDDGFHIVSVRSFNDFSASINELQSVRADVTPKAWIYILR